MIRKFVCPEIVFGFGAINQLAYFVQNLDLQNVLIVTDPGVIDAGWAEKGTDELKDKGISFMIYHAITPNPKMAEVMAGAEVYEQARCDGIIAIGGGSVMDCAKGIGIVASNPEHITAFEGVDNIVMPMPPLICVPTTAGSSADVSQFSIITDTSRHVKMAIISKAIVPDVAIIDPQTLTTMNSYLSACTGIDALVHGIESYVSNAHSCLTDPYAMRAIKLVSQNLLKSIEEPLNIEYRHEMMLGSMSAGLAFSNASLGLVHAMAHSLGGFLDLAHGECNALLLEHVIQFNYREAHERYTEINRVINPGSILEDEEAARELIDSIIELKASVGIEESLTASGVAEDHLPRLAKFAFQDACVYTNPRKPTIAEIEGVFRSAL